MRRFIILTTLAVSACGDDAEVTPDATQASETTSETTSDAGEEVTPDATVAETTPETDVVQTHGTVAGTHLEGIAVQFPASLELCSAWNEGASLADEKARKVRITIAGKTTSTLDEDALRQSFSGVVVETGPDRAHRVRPATELTLSADYTLNAGGGGLGTTLYATITHDLAGAGTLTESYFISRTAENRAPVVVDPGTMEVLFFYKAAGSQLEPTRLERCGVGPTGSEDAVSVVIAQDAGKKKWAALIRYWRTYETDAGSAPAVLLGHRLIHSDDYWFASDAMGFWSTTYSAKHHNHDEDIEVDYTRDLGKWHTVFRDPDPEATPIARVLAENLRAGSTGGTLTIERLAPGGARTTEVLDVPDAMFTPRVDATALARTLTCANGSVLAAGSHDAWFQMLLCPEGQTQALVAVVPVVWALDIVRSGVRVEGEAIKTVTGGWDVTIGDDVLEIRPQGDRWYSEVKRGGELVTGTSEIPYALGEPPEVMHSPVGGESDDGTVSFSIQRRWAGLGIGKSQLWAPLYFTLTYPGGSYTVDAWDALSYTNTHHNWADVLEGVADDGTVIKWRTAFMEGIPNEVSVTSSSGAVLLVPTTLPTPD